jgi:CzcA family heavy metal efflux pump
MRGERGLQAWLIRTSIRRRNVAIVLSLLLLLYAFVRLAGARYEVFPEFAPPQAVVQTEAPGLAPEQVEKLVTQPIENALAGVPGLDSLRSSSIQGLSLVTATFAPESDIYRDRQIVAERLASVTLPKGVAAPTMTPLTSSTSTLLVVGLTSPTRSPTELRTLAEWTIRPRLLATPGVAKVAIFGGGENALQVRLDPDRLIGHGLGVKDIVAAAGRATGLRGAGFIDTPNQRLVLQTEGQTTTAAALAGAVVAVHDGAPLTLGEVAGVAEAPMPPIGGASIMGKPGVELAISSQYGANTLRVTRAVETALAELKPALEREGVELHGDLFRPATFIDNAMAGMRSSLILGGLLVIAVISVFLFDWRTALISSAAIPLSLLAATVVLDAFDVSLNTMTLGGLAIAVGVVVDDAVVDVENIVRRLRENAHRRSPRAAARVILDACMEVRGAVTYATFAVLLLVVPVVRLSGLAGRLFTPLGLAYSAAVLASLAVALTVTPAMAMALLGDRALPEQDPPVMRWAKRRYESGVRAACGHPRFVVGAAAALTLAGCATLPLFGASFIPELKEGHFIVHMAEAPGASIAESLRMGQRVTKALLAVPGVRLVAQRTGRAELSDDVLGTHYSEFDVDLKPLRGDAAEAAESDIRKALAPFVGVVFGVNTFLTERVEETLSGAAAGVVVDIFGDDLDAIDRKAAQIASVLKSIPGAADVQVQAPAGMQQVVIRLRPDDLRRWGIAAVDALDAVRTAYQGQTVGEVYRRGRVVPVVVVLAPGRRGDAAAIGDLPLDAPGGAIVRLAQVADIVEGVGRYEVLHKGARRVQTVSANVTGRDVVSFVAAARKAIAEKVALPGGLYLQFSGEAEAQGQSWRDLLVNSLLAGVGVVLLLSIVTRNARNLLLVLATLPFAVVGGALAVFASGGLLSLGAMVGFVTLTGISLRNSILMVSHYEHLVTADRQPWAVETAIKGAADRLTPILMTSLVTALGVLPLALAMHEPGREIEGPMAAVILGGLLSSMALNLLVLPILALRYGRFEITDQKAPSIISPP